MIEHEQFATKNRHGWVRLSLKGERYKSGICYLECHDHLINRLMCAFLKRDHKQLLQTWIKPQRFGDNTFLQVLSEIGCLNFTKGRGYPVN